MNNGLKEYFPVIREREEVLDEIYQKPSLKALFETWTEKQQEEFLDYCTGVKGIKLLYDSFLRKLLIQMLHQSDWKKFYLLSYK